MGFIKKVFDFVAHPTHSRTMGLLVMIFLVSAVFLTVNVAQQQQTTKQQAASCRWECDPVDPTADCWLVCDPDAPPPSLCDDTECSSRAHECQYAYCDSVTQECVVTNEDGGLCGTNGTCYQGSCNENPLPPPQPPTTNCHMSNNGKTCNDRYSNENNGGGYTSNCDASTNSAVKYFCDTYSDLCSFSTTFCLYEQNGLICSINSDGFPGCSMPSKPIASCHMENKNSCFDNDSDVVLWTSGCIYGKEMDYTDIVSCSGYVNQGCVHTKTPCQNGEKCMKDADGTPRCVAQSASCDDSGNVYCVDREGKTQAFSCGVHDEDNKIARLVCGSNDLCNKHILWQTCPDNLFCKEFFDPESEATPLSISVPKCVPACIMITGEKYGNNYCHDRKSLYSPHCSDEERSLTTYACASDDGICQASEQKCPPGEKCEYDRLPGGVYRPKCIRPSSPPLPISSNYPTSPTVPISSTAPTPPIPSLSPTTAPAVTLASALNAQDVTLNEASLSAKLVLYNLTTNTMVSSTSATQSFIRTSIPENLNMQNKTLLYSANIALTGLYPEEYFLVIRKDNMIAKSIFTVLDSVKLSTIPTTTLVFGDLNNDNEIDIITDYSMFKNCWEQPSTDACSSSDFNQSGGNVDEVDYNIWLRGFATWQKEGQGL